MREHFHKYKAIVFIPDRTHPEIFEIKEMCELCGNICNNTEIVCKL